MDAGIVRSLALVATGSLALGAVVLTSRQEQPASQTAASTSSLVCVNKKTTDMRWPKSGKCQKGWRKQTFAAQGPAGAPGTPGGPGSAGAPGPQGPAGPDLPVKDAQGKVLGTFRGYNSLGPIAQIFVSRSDGDFLYNANGLLQPTGHVAFFTNTCTGKAYALVNVTVSNQLLSAVGSASRAVVRQTRPTYGPARAYKLTSTHTDTMKDYYVVDESGTCVKTGNQFTAAYFEYEEIPAPPDVTGPLAIG